MKFGCLSLGFITSIVLTVSSSGVIYFEDQFDDLSQWSVTNRVTDESGVHSAIHFDEFGAEIAATGTGHATFGGAQTDPVNSISTSFNLIANETYTILFRYRSFNDNGNDQIINSQITLGVDSANSGALTANSSYQTGSYSFTPTTSGSATLTFDDTGTNTASNDLMLDSVVVIPEPSSVLLLGLGSLVFFSRRKR